MAEHTSQVAEMYRNFAKSPVYKHLIEACQEEANGKRKNASKSQDTAYGELRFADGIEWVLDHIKQQQVIDKMGGRRKVTH